MPRLTALPQLLACAALLASALAAAREKRPNILFIFSDDHALKAISAYGNKPLMQTPCIDRIASEGMIFTRSYCTNSICGPSRASILTGLHSHRNGFFANGRNPFDGAQTTFPKLLQSAGYQTALIGKWHLESTPTGFHHFEILPGQGHYYNPDFIGTDGKTRRREGYSTDLVTDLALEWLDARQNPDQPFLLMVQHKAPHRTFAPPPRHLATFPEGTIPEPDSLFDDYSGGRSRTLAENEMEIARHFRWHYDLKVRDFNPDNSPNSGCPEYARMSPAQKQAWDAHFEPLNAKLKQDHAAGRFQDPRSLTRWKYQRYLSNYLGTVAAVDESVGRILDHLERTKLAENTIVIYSSDQGFYLGEHGWYDKRWVFEESYAMPFLIRWPGVIQPGSKSAKLIQNIDYAPTLLEAAGLPVPKRMQGRSLLPLLRGENPPWRDALLYAYYEYGEHRVPEHVAVTTERHKLIHFPATNEWNLMDLVADPAEMRSFHDDPAYAATRSSLEQRLAELKQQYAHCPSTIPTPRGDDWWMPRHREKVRAANQNAASTKVVFVGDSITQGWEGAGKDLWARHIAPLGALNLGFSGDRTEHVLWRLHNGEWPASLQPETTVIMIGTNNTGHANGQPAEETAVGIQLIVEDILDRAPHTRIVLLAIFPRGKTASDPKRRINDAINRSIAKLADHPQVEFHDLTPRFLDPQGNLPATIMPDALHPNPAGYQIWLDALLPLLTPPTP